MGGVSAWVQVISGGWGRRFNGFFRPFAEQPSQPDRAGAIGSGVKNTTISPLFASVHGGAGRASTSPSAAHQPAKASSRLRHSLFPVALALAAAIGPASIAGAAETIAESPGAGWTLGTEVLGLPGEFGVGLHVLTPGLFGENFRLKIGGSNQWLRGRLPGQEAQSRVGYTSFRLGVHISFPFGAKGLTGYSEGGVLETFPESRLSGRSFVLGGYGVFGLEFRMSRASASFVEFGGIGSGARAERLVGRPSYSRGFVVAAGVRFRLD